MANRRCQNVKWGVVAPAQCFLRKPGCGDRVQYLVHPLGVDGPFSGAANLSCVNRKQQEELDHDRVGNIQEESPDNRNEQKRHM